ncbi:MAG: hypothetical protein HDS75_02635 [Bacteroidales bacterium]|nr:hypothetical protein [Bacteroidales bacterium]
MNRFFILAMTSVLLSGCNYGGIPQSAPSSDSSTKPEIERIRVAEIIDYTPAPGQYVNLLPPASVGETLESVKAKVSDYLNRGYTVTLGSFGGSITVRLAEPIRRRPGMPDFFVGGNAITNGSEPGIVEVSEDGATWYQLQGEFPPSDLPLTRITYTRVPPEENIPYSAVAADGAATEGFVYWLPQYHPQYYWPEWEQSPTLSYTALRLPDNARPNPDTGQYEFTPYAGYADSYPNSSPAGYLSLDDAIDTSTGAPADLSSITYIRVTTSILQSNGSLGEASTEVSGIYSIR